MHNAMTVDVEDWFQVGAFEGVISRGSWAKQTSRVVRNVDTLLELFADHDVQATFFFLGWIAERYPALVRRVAEAGHEIASHGYAHHRVHSMTPDAFRADVQRTQAILEGLTGQAVRGYRAPSFSIDHRTPWAHAILADLGYRYSSSVVAIRHDHYGWPDTPRFAWAPVPDQSILEIPVSTVSIARTVFPAGGGGFFRLYPYWLSNALIKRIHAEGQPAVFYLHPWELDAGQPRVRQAPLRSRLRHYMGIGRMRDKLDRLLRDHAWGRLDAHVPTALRHRG